MTRRRMGPPDAAVRMKLLDAAERVLGRDGYPAVTSRNVGREAGVDQKLVFYYFKNMEDLVVATFRRRSEVFLAELERLATMPSPLQALWKLSSDRSGKLIVEFMAMAMRNEALRNEVAQHSARANLIIDAMVAAALPPSCSEGGDCSPAFVNFAIASIARNLILESELGILHSPNEVSSSMAALLERLESSRLRQ
jgi:AcrR family transcriptional regulator